MLSKKNGEMEVVNELADLRLSGQGHQLGEVLLFSSLHFNLGACLEEAQQASLIDETTGSDTSKKKGRAGVIFFFPFFFLAIFGVGNDAPDAPSRRFIVRAIGSYFFERERKEGRGGGLNDELKNAGCYWPSLVVLGRGRSIISSITVLVTPSPTFFTTNFLFFFFAGYRHLYTSIPKHVQSRAVF